METLEKLTADFIQNNKHLIARWFWGESLEHLIECIHFYMSETTKEESGVNSLISFVQGAADQFGYNATETNVFWDYFYQILIPNYTHDIVLTNEWMRSHCLFFLMYFFRANSRARPFEDGVPFPIDYADEDEFELVIVKRNGLDEFDVTFRKKEK